MNFKDYNELENKGVKLNFLNNFEVLEEITNFPSFDQ